MMAQCGKLQPWIYFYFLMAAELIKKAGIAQL